MSQKIISAFGLVELPPQQCKDPVSEKDIIDTLIIDTFEQDEAGNIKPITKQIVTGKKNRKAYIESFSDEAGLRSILEKVSAGAISEDKYSILNGQNPGDVTDLTPLGDIKNLGDIQALADKAKYTFEHLDPDLKKGMSFIEFCSKFNNADLEAYVKAKIPAPKEGDNV